MEVDYTGDCLSAVPAVAFNVEVQGEYSYPLSPACSVVSESDVSVTSEKGRGEQLDLEKVIRDSYNGTAKVPMRSLRKAVPELYRRCYQGKKAGKRKVKFSWDPLNKPHDWPATVRFVDPNNGVKGKNGRFGNKPSRKELELMFVFLREKFRSMSQRGCQSEQVAERPVDVKPVVKKMPVEESVPTPCPTVDVQKIKDRLNDVVKTINKQENQDPRVKARLECIKTELYGMYNRVIAETQEMTIYMNFNSQCRKVEELIDNVNACGPDYVNQYFEVYSQEILDGLRVPSQPSGGFRQETSVDAIQATLEGQNQIHMQSYEPTKTEPPACAMKEDFENCGPLSGLFEDMKPSQLVKTVGFCSEPEVPQLNMPLDWVGVFKQQDGWCDQVIDKVAGDDEFKYASTPEDLFGLLQVDVRRTVDTEGKADDSESLEKETKLLEVPGTKLVCYSSYTEDVPMMEGIEDGSELPSDTTSSVGNLQLTMPTDVPASVSFDVSASPGPVGNLSPIAIHDHVARQVSPHEEHFNCEVPSFVEEFDEPDVMMGDPSLSNTCLDLDKSFSDLSDFGSGVFM